MGGGWRLEPKTVLLQGGPAASRGSSTDEGAVLGFFEVGPRFVEIISPTAPAPAEEMFGKTQNYSHHVSQH